MDSALYTQISTELVELEIGLTLSKVSFSPFISSNSRHAARQILYISISDDQLLAEDQQLTFQLTITTLHLFFL